MTYKQAREFLDAQAGRGSVLGLATMRELCRRLGNPQNTLQFIHIAGTNGKGSVGAYTTSVLKAAGIKCGWYTSPAVFGDKEQYTIGGTKITGKRMGELCEELKRAAEEMEADGFAYPTLFELETALAFLYFAKEKCALVVLETGMGGDLDATNIIENTLVCVFVSIGRDHMGFLGNSLTEIAQKKAGILKKGAAAVSSMQEDEVCRVLLAKAEEMETAVTFLEEKQILAVKYGLQKQSFSYKQYKKLEITMTGMVQIENAALAVEVVDALNKAGFSISEKALRKGLLAAKWPGRLEILRKRPLFIIDGAHNAPAAKRLSSFLQYYFTNKRLIFIMGMLKDKEAGLVLQETADYAEHIVTVTPPENPRALPAIELAKLAGEYHRSVTEAGSVEEALEIAHLLAGADGAILAFGSLSYLGKLKAVFQKEYLHGRSEKSRRSN